MRAPVLLLLAACAGEADRADRGDTVDDAACATGGPGQVLLTRSLAFARATEGTSVGFDLDGYDTTQGHPEGCGVADYVGPEGATGVDNAMAALLPILDGTEAVVLEELMQASINDGSMLLMLELLDLDDPADDACVDLAVFQGTGQPMVGADGWLLPNQTLDVAADSPFTVTAGGSLVEGVFAIGPVDAVPLHITVLDLNATFDIHDVRLELSRGDDGVWRGVLGGGLAVADLMTVVNETGVDQSVADLMEPALALVADLAPGDDGRCTQLSVALQIELVPVFVFE